MDVDERVSTIQNLLGDQVMELERSLPRRAYVRIAPENVTAAVKILFEECGGRLVTVSGLDTRDGIDILYHFAFDADRIRLAQVWRGRFIDAHGTWFNRFQPPIVPLGVNVIGVSPGAPHRGIQGA